MSVHEYTLLGRPVGRRGIIFLLEVGIPLRAFNHKELQNNPPLSLENMKEKFTPPIPFLWFY